MILEPIKQSKIKIGQCYYTQIGPYMDRVIIVEVVMVWHRRFHGSTKLKAKLAKVRRVGSKRSLPKLRQYTELYRRA